VCQGGNRAAHGFLHRTLDGLVVACQSLVDGGIGEVERVAHTLRQLPGLLKLADVLVQQVTH
jgi:hypothetical protein